ncbi:MAG: dihydropteroate synthase family protein [Microthrixaceae bacterium]
MTGPESEAQPLPPAAAVEIDATRVMGVLNVTPDSFSDGGQHFDTAAAIFRAREMVEQGADVIDVGGESTRPGAQPVDPLDEQRRVIPVIEGIIEMLGSTSSNAGPPSAGSGSVRSGSAGSGSAGSGSVGSGSVRPIALGPRSAVRISIDTRNADTARRAVGAGATLINDVSATLATTAAELGVGWVAMHMLGDPRTMQASPLYDDVVDDVKAFLVERASEAVRLGVKEIWIDPGIGFGKTIAHNMELLSRLDEIVAEGFPVLIGTSRKRFLGELTARSDAHLAPLHPPVRSGSTVAKGTAVETENSTSPAPSDVPSRLDASLATATWAMLKGAKMVRVHDVDATAQAVAVISGSIPGR